MASNYQYLNAIQFSFRSGSIMTLSQDIGNQCELTPKLESASQKGKHPLRKNRVLIVDDNHDIINLYANLLRSIGCSVDEADSLKSLRKLILSRYYDTIILDIYLGDGTGLEAVSEIIQTAPLTQIIILTSHDSVNLAVDAMKLGVSGFLLKTDTPNEFLKKFTSIISIENEDDVTPLIDTEKLGIIGKSTQLTKIINKIYRIRDVDSTVLISGESGTGKELIAKAIHNLSKRSSQPFLAINCAALSPSLLEAELFGHKKGAFTDAKENRKGFFEICSKGTLFLDEIGEMPLQLQAKILRVLQEREVTPVGSCNTVKVNTRVIAATNRDLDYERDKGKFREDLFYRLSVLHMHLPSLKDRKEDIESLVENFVQIFNQKFNKKIRRPNSNVFARIKSYSWPGNIRELRNAIERAVILADSNEMRLEDLLPFKELEKSSISLNQDENGHEFFTMPENFMEAKKLFEKTYIKKILKISSGNITEAARLSGQFRANIYRLIKKHDIKVSDITSIH